MSATACTDCGHVHAAGNTIAIDRFSPLSGYRSRVDPAAPIRSSRAEADADTCRWRQTHQPPAVIAPIRPRPSEDIEQPGRPAPTPFPAAEYELLAREGAWRRFLAEALLSLKVWQLEPLAGLQDPRDWLSACHAELGALLTARAEPNA